MDQESVRIFAQIHEQGARLHGLVDQSSQALLGISLHRMRTRYETQETCHRILKFYQSLEDLSEDLKDPVFLSLLKGAQVVRANAKNVQDQLHQYDSQTDWVDDRLVDKLQGELNDLKTAVRDAQGRANLLMGELQRNTDLGQATCILTALKEIEAELVEDAPKKLLGEPGARSDRNLFQRYHELNRQVRNLHAEERMAHEMVRPVSYDDGAGLLKIRGA